MPKPCRAARRPLRRRPLRALGPACLGERLLRSGRLAHQLRRAFLSRSERHAARDSWLVERLRAAGAVITGKTHLHPLAYGITGENPEFGDCLQPRRSDALTGGSSSGAAASVLEGSAVAAIGTDTGGSIRVPAALCGLAGYRASLGRGDWRGGAHLAGTFDTMGWLFRDLEDAPLFAAPFAPSQNAPAPPSRASPSSQTAFCTIANRRSSRLSRRHSRVEALGLERRSIDARWWADAVRSSRPSRPRKRRAFTPATSISSNLRFASA